MDVNNFSFTVVFIKAIPMWRFLRIQMYLHFTVNEVGET